MSLNMNKKFFILLAIKYFDISISRNKYVLLKWYGRCFLFFYFIFFYLIYILSLLWLFGCKYHVRWQSQCTVCRCEGSQSFSRTVKFQFTKYWLVLKIVYLLLHVWLIFVVSLTSWVCLSLSINGFFKHWIKCFSPASSHSSSVSVPPLFPVWFVYNVNNHRVKQLLFSLHSVQCVFVAVVD